MYFSTTLGLVGGASFVLQELYLRRVVEKLKIDIRRRDVLVAQLGGNPASPSKFVIDLPTAQYKSWVGIATTLPNVLWRPDRERLVHLDDKHTQVLREIVFPSPGLLDETLSLIGVVTFLTVSACQHPTRVVRGVGVVAAFALYTASLCGVSIAAYMQSIVDNAPANGATPLSLFGIEIPIESDV